MQIFISHLKFADLRNFGNLISCFEHVLEGVWYTCQLSRVTQWSTIVHVLFFWLSEQGSLAWVTNKTADVSFVFLWHFSSWGRGGKGKIDPLTHNRHLSAVLSSLGWKSHVVIYWPWFRILSSFAGICFWEIYKTSQSLVLW